MIYALIPARGGSKRIPRKNLEKVGGVSLVARAIRTARQAAVVDRVYVSTDDPEIADEARRERAYVVGRPPDLAGDLSLMDDTVRHFLLAVDAHDDDVLLLLEPTAPLRVWTDLDLAINVLRALPNYVPAVRLVSTAVGDGCHAAAYLDAGLASALRVPIGPCLFPVHTVLVHHGDDRAIDVDESADLERARAAADA